MTITLTVEEIRAYEDQCNTHVINFFMALIEFKSKQARNEFLDPRNTADEDRKFLQGWMKDHPVPKLLPTI
jgi:hypothetical protein